MATQTPFKKLRKDLGRAINQDPFKDGTVIRWDWTPNYSDAFIASGGARKYTWVALRAGGRWYVTGQNERVLDYEGLVELLARDSSSNVEVATAWESI